MGVARKANSLKKPTAPRSLPPGEWEKAVDAQKECGQRLRLPVEITNSIGMKLKLIPEGVFMMGSLEPDCGRAFTFRHRERIAVPFYLGCYEVTQAEYERVMNTNPSWFSPKGERKGDVAGLDTSRFPVENITWLEAAEFCRRLSKLPEEKAAERIYRLPTEAEWEYACRAGTTTPFYFGTQLTRQQANFHNCHRRPTIVGSYAPNAFGLYDMHGNVIERCNDWDTLGMSPAGGDAQGTHQATYRFKVGRGGGWKCAAKDCRSAIRLFAKPHVRSGGFRVVLVRSAG